LLFTHTESSYGVFVRADKGRATGGWADVGTLSYQIALMLMKLLLKVMACNFVTP